MSDLIDREETIRAIDSLGEDYISYYKLLMLIGRLPSAESVRKAKVMKHKYWLGVSLNVVGEQTIGYEWICEICKKKVLSGDDYCSHCGAKLDWSE